ncbi:hypothetical protein SNEBB_004781 [Seison nebaliae]|nr:hypothetical protein SNEBB_004781 [Seison nebaliae]
MLRNISRNLSSHLVRNELPSNHSLVKVLSGNLVKKTSKKIDKTNIISYVDRSECLQNLLKLGIPIGKWNRKSNINNWILTIDWKKDVEPLLKYLISQLNFTVIDCGRLLSKNIHIVRIPIYLIQNRINFLLSYGLCKEEISNSFKSAPYLLNFEVERLENRLNFYERAFDLTREETCLVIGKHAKLLTSKINDVVTVRYTMKYLMELKEDVMKSILLESPNVYLSDKDKMRKNLNYMENELGEDRDNLLIECPQLLTVSFDKVIQPRISFLKNRFHGNFTSYRESKSMINSKNILSENEKQTPQKFSSHWKPVYYSVTSQLQRDPTKPLYIHLKTLLLTSDVMFCSFIALNENGSLQDEKDVLQEYYRSIKTL